MLKKLNNQLEKYFNTSNFHLKEIKQGRTNTNFFIQIGDNEYFLRTNIIKANDSLFGGKLEKEYNILMTLFKYGISAKPLYFYNDGGLQFLITEKLNGFSPNNFYDNQDIVIDLLKIIQQINIYEFSFLKEYSIISDFNRLLVERLNNINNIELKDILVQMMNFLTHNRFNISEELCLSHNDFRSDNIIISDNRIKTFIIDLESLMISDKYLDIAEYYIGGIFWNNFNDIKSFNYSTYSNFMGKYGYSDKLKQKYIYILKFCSNFSWLSAYVSNNKKILLTYIEILEINKNKFYNDILPIL